MLVIWMLVEVFGPRPVAPCLTRSSMKGYAPECPNADFYLGALRCLRYSSTWSFRTRSSCRVVPAMTVLLLLQLCLGVCSRLQTGCFLGRIRISLLIAFWSRELKKSQKNRIHRIWGPSDTNKEIHPRQVRKRHTYILYIICTIKNFRSTAPVAIMLEFAVLCVRWCVKYIICFSSFLEFRYMNTQLGLEMNMFH